MAKKKPEIIGYIDAKGNFDESITMPKSSVRASTKQTVKTSSPTSNQNLKRTVKTSELQDNRTIKTEDIGEKQDDTKTAIKKYGETIRDSRVKNDGLSVSNVITDLANLSDAKKNVAKSLPVIGKLFQAQDTAKKTVENVATNMGTGAMKAVEGAADLASDLVFNPMEQRYNYAFDLLTKGKKTADENLKDLKKMQQRDIKKSQTEDFQKATGFSDVVGEREKGSLVTRENLGGQLSQGIGGMVPSLVLGEALGSVPELTKLSELKGKEKLTAGLGNIAKTYKAQLPANLMLGAQSYGGGVEEALNKGATMDQARKYGLANAAIEQGTEWMTGGIPGLGGKGGIDNLLEPLIDKSTKGYANALLKGLYGTVGEGLEEKAGTYLDALARQGILGEDINWKDVKKQSDRDFLLGALIGGILNGPTNIQSIQDVRNERMQNGNINNNINNLISSDEQVRAINDIVQQKETGQIDAATANQMLADVQNGTYQQNQNTQAVIQEAQRQFDEINQAEQTGQIDNQSAQQGRQAIINTMNDMQQSQTQEEVEKNQEIGYNKDTNEVGVKNDFRTIQEESRAKLNDKGWGSSSKTVDEDLRGRIRGALSEEIKRRGYSDSNNDGLLKLESKGNQFNLHKNVDGETFHDIFEIARAHTDNGELVDLHPIKTNEDSTGYEEMNNYLSEDGMQGFSITKDGDVVSVFNADPSKKGFLRSIINEINTNGKTLDCFNSSKQRLDEIYSKVFGWKTTSVMDHNMEYDHDDIAKNHNNPPVSFMVNPNQLKSDVTDADLNKQFGKDQYDEAVEYRNALMKGGEGNKSDFVFDENGRFVEKRTSDSSFNIDKEKQEIVKSNGKVVTAPIDTKGKNKLANININVNNDGGNNNNIGNNALAKQGDSNNGKEAQILENYKDRKAYKKEPFKERAAEFMHNAVRGLFDSAEEIVRIGKYHNDKQLNPLYDLTLTANSTADFNIGGMKDSYQSNLSGEKIGESLENCWKPVEDAGLVRQMNAYLYEQHNIDRWNQFNDDGSRKYVFGPEHSDLVSKRNIAEMLKVHPELKELSKPILNYQNNLLKVLVESGQVSQSHADYLNEIYKNYVPTWRDKDVQNNKTLKNSKGKIDINNPLKEATGSTEDLLPLKEVQAQMTKNVFKTSRTNLFGQQLYKDIGDLSKLKDIGMNELNKQYVQNGKKDVVDENAFLKAGEQYLDEYLRDFAPNNVPVDIVKGQKTMNVYFNGVKVAMPIDSGIETALKPLKPQNDAAKILSKINNFKRGVITQYNPGFSISNALKDAPDAMLNSKYGKEFPVEYAKTMKEMLERGISKGDQELFNQYCALGGLSNRTFDGFEGFKQDSKAKKALTFVPNAISDVNDIIEQIPRFTEFKLSLKHGATLSEAMYNAADLTTNFKRGGTLTKALDAYGTTFLSASTGGFYKQVRNITQQPNGKAFLMFAAKGMALGLTPAIINSLLYASPFGDDDDKKEAKEAYEKLKQYEKDDYLLWYRGDGKFIKIPKGRAVSIPAIIYNAVKETAKGNKVNAKDVFTSVLNQIGPNNPLSDNAILSFSQIELLNKKSQGKSWSGSPIESSYMQSLEPRLRYDSKTDEFSKWLGDKLNVSPKKINYVIQQNTGILGDLLLPAITPKTTGPNVLSRTTNFLTKRFTTDTVSSNTTTEKFYDKQTELTELQNNPEKASDKNEIKKMYLNSKGGEIAEKRKEIEEINSNKTMSKDDKYKEIRKKQKEINKIAEDALKESEKVQKEGKYAALIGDNVYVKAKNDKWYKENESNKEKREELGLNIKDYYHYKKDEAFIKPDGKSTSLVDGEKAKEKIALVDAFGFDPSDYLEYEYTINNIKEGKNTKRKVFEYINSLDISQEQKIILMKKKYKTYRSYDRQIFNTINNTDLTLEEKESLANFLKIK